MTAPDLRIFSSDEWSAEAAALLAADIEEVVAERGRCRLALAGGSTPVPVYQHLAAPPLSTRLPWAEVEVFFGDERAVPPDDPSSNYAMAREALLDPLAIEADNVHRIRGELPPAEAARAYAQELGDAPLDIVLLGMGGDGHTASLFPGTPELDSGERVRVTRSPVPPTERVSLGLPVLKGARKVYFLVSGAGKAARLAEVKAQIDDGAPVLPAARVQPTNGLLIWLLDDEAAAKLAPQTSEDKT